MSARNLRAAQQIIEAWIVADPDGGAWDAYIWLDNADALYAEFKSKGVTIKRDICDQPYNCRDFEVEDCNGYRLCFGQNIEG